MTDLLVKIFVKNYKDVGNSRTRERYGIFTGVTGIVTNIFLFGIKAAAGLIFGSIAIVADAVNNLSDSGASVVMLAGFKISGKPADENHPYGHARMEHVSGLIVSVIIIFLGLQMAWTSFDKIINPEKPQFSLLSVGVLVFSILIKLWQYLFYRKIGARIKSSAIYATSHDSRNDMFATAAVLVSVLISRFTGLNLDGYMGFAVSLFILANGTSLVKETISPLLGTAPDKEFVDYIYKKIQSYDGIIGLHDLQVHTYGPSKCFASVHCEVPPDMEIMTIHDTMDEIERDFLENENIHLVIHPDPLEIDDNRTNELRMRVAEILADISPELRMHDFRVSRGQKSVKLIFDILAPFDCKHDDDELIKRVKSKIYEIDKGFTSVITVDHHYAP